MNEGVDRSGDSTLTPELQEVVDRALRNSPPSIVAELDGLQWGDLLRIAVDLARRLDEWTRDRNPHEECDPFEVYYYFEILEEIAAEFRSRDRNLSESVIANFQGSISLFSVFFRNWEKSEQNKAVNAANGKAMVIVTTAIQEGKFDEDLVSRVWDLDALEIYSLVRLLNSRAKARLDRVWAVYDECSRGGWPDENQLARFEADKAAYLKLRGLQANLFALLEGMGAAPGMEESLRDVCKDLLASLQERRGRSACNLEVINNPMVRLFSMQMRSLLMKVGGKD
ncbi:hypothetical protein KKC94_04675 [Patescibacteria group bacterium]|nr:hypothetical protein [Patescibacteria group bacterium]